MKILKLSFENINSLKGKWQIDFEDAAFFITMLYLPSQAPQVLAKQRF